MSTPDTLNRLAEIASSLLQANLGQGITLHSPRLVKDGIRCRIVRCAVTTPSSRGGRGSRRADRRGDQFAEGSAGASPSPVLASSLSTPGSTFDSVIVKQIKPDREAARGFTDWASLAFLSSLAGSGDETRGAGLPPGEAAPPHPVPPPQSTVHGRTLAEQELGATRLAAGLAPRFYGGDVETGVYVIEDLGGSLTLDDLLNGRDTSTVWDAMRRLAIQAARLNAATAGREEEFLRIRAALPGAECVERSRDAEQWLAGRPRLHAWFEAVACPLPAGFDAALARIADSYADPGPFLAFTHGDFAPSNNHVAGEEVRLLDFEYGGFRHALYDITAWNVLCPLPEPLVYEISRCYREELARTCPAAGDDACYREAWATISAYRALAMLTWIPCGIMEANRSWVGEWSAREAVLAALRRLIDATTAQQELQPITEAALGLKRKLRARWPEYGEVLPAWPALRAGGDG